MIKKFLGKEFSCDEVNKGWDAADNEKFLGQELSSDEVNTGPEAFCN